METIPEELCLSLPVPVEWEGSVIDAFFTYSIDMDGMYPYPAKDCRMVFEDGSVVIDSSAFGIDSIDFQYGMSSHIENWYSYFQSAYDNYEAAYKACIANERSFADAYVAAVKKATRPEQIPYYQAMNPWLFGDLSIQGVSNACETT